MIYLIIFNCFFFCRLFLYLPLFISHYISLSPCRNSTSSRTQREKKNQILPRTDYWTKTTPKSTESTITLYSSMDQLQEINTQTLMRKKPRTEKHFSLSFSCLLIFLSECFSTFFSTEPRIDYLHWLLKEQKKKQKTKNHRFNYPLKLILQNCP